jgi:hypothetical protein
MPHFFKVMKRAKAIYKGEAEESWGDIRELIKPCAVMIKSST